MEAKRALGLLGMELQAVVSALIWVLETPLWSRFRDERWR